MLSKVLARLALTSYSGSFAHAVPLSYCPIDQMERLNCMSLAFRLFVLWPEEHYVMSLKKASIKATFYNVMCVYYFLD